MSASKEYVLGQSARAAHRLAIQDEQFADVSEQLLDSLDIKHDWRIVEMGCGPGGFSKRIARRLGAGGVLVSVDASTELLAHARTALGSCGPAKFEPVQADITDLGNWLHGANAVVGRAVLHHIPMAEFMLGKLRTRVAPGTRIGFIEPDFRSPLGKIGYLRATGHTEMEALSTWALAINQLYLARRISPAVGASLAQTLEFAGYRNVQSSWAPCPASATTLENMSMFYDEVRNRLAELHILTNEEVDRQKRMLAELKPDTLPPAWGTYRVTCET
jgi:ubiquinone/menaquinone biosynthesis C-methylase UbiE